MIENWTMHEENQEPSGTHTSLTLYFRVSIVKCGVVLPPLGSLNVKLILNGSKKTPVAACTNI